MQRAISKETESVALFLKRIKISAPILVFLFFSCSGEAPQMHETWHQLNLISDPETGKTHQSLSFFIHGEDEDGENDLDQIYLINDEKQYFWNIPSTLWTSYKDRGVPWIGFNNIIAPDRGIFPEGDYRVLLIDIGGDRDEKSFYLRNNIPREDEVSLPEIYFDKNSLTVKSDFLKFQVWFYGEGEEFLEKSQDFTMRDYQWNEIIPNIRRRALSFKIYTEAETGSWGLVSGPFIFTDQL